MPATLTTDTMIIKIQDTKVANKCRIDTIKREHTENKHNSDVFTHITADTKETYKGSSHKLQWIYHQKYNHLKIIDSELYGPLTFNEIIINRSFFQKIVQGHQQC